MTLTELREHLAYFYDADNTLGVVLYVVYDDENGNERVGKVDTDEAARDELLEMYLESLEAKFIENEGLSYRQITEADSRKNAAYYYNLDTRPAGLAVLTTINQTPEQDEFTYNADDFERIKGFVVSIGSEVHKVLLYKSHHHLSLIRARTVFGMRMSNRRFEKVREDIIKLSPGFDFVLVGDHLVVNSLKVLESKFGFDEVVRIQVTANLTTLEDFGLLEDMQPLKDFVEDKRHARKLLGVTGNSPVMQKTPEEICAFVKAHPNIKKKFRFSQDGKKLRLHTDVSKRLLLKLLNDDFLNSKLTLREYDSLAKDHLPEEQ